MRQIKMHPSKPTQWMPVLKAHRVPTKKSTREKAHKSSNHGWLWKALVNVNALLQSPAGPMMVLRGE
jgi:hypothetical protein